MPLQGTSAVHPGWAKQEHGWCISCPSATGLFLGDNHERGIWYSSSL